MANDFQPTLKPPKEMQSEGASCPLAGAPLPVPGFWSRLFAFAVDLAALVFVLRFFGTLFRDFLYPMRDVTQWIGALGVYAYFVMCLGPVGKGQTIGKRLFRHQVVDEAGASLSWGAAAVRGAFLWAAFYACLVLVLPLFLGMTLRFPQAPWMTQTMACFAYLSLAFWAGNAVWISLHPHKRGLHDLLLQAQVCRAEEKEDAVEWLGHPADQDRAKIKLAKWPALILAGTVLFVPFRLVTNQGFWLGAVPAQTKSMEALQDASTLLEGVEGLRLEIVIGPSTEMATASEARRERMLESIRQRGETLPTTDSLRYWPTGRKFHFMFSTDDLVTSETLAAGPGMDALRERLPGVAVVLSEKYYMEDDGPAPYEDIQVDFFQALPLFGHYSVQPVYQDVWSVEGAAAESEDAP